MPRVLVHIKEVARLRASTGAEEPANLVVAVEVFNATMPVVLRDGADYAIQHPSDLTVAVGWYGTGNPPVFAPDPDLDPPVVDNDAYSGMGSIEIIDATKARNREMVEAMLAETEAALDAAKNRMTNGG